MIAHKLAFVGLFCAVACGGGSPQPAPEQAPQSVAPGALVEAKAEVAVVTGDARRGEEVYQQCLACHALGYDRTGPHHCGVVGRRAGSVEGFDYSEAMRNSGLVWDKPTLDRFLKDPMGTVPGTKMTYAGVKDDGERADLIAYLAEATRDPSLCDGV